jgi:DNA-binding transcriptional ArsR family regulator
MGHERPDLFRAIAHPTRRHVLMALEQHEPLTQAQLCAGVAETRFAVAKHIAVLERAGIVTSKREGRTRLHYLAGPALPH